MALLEPQSTAGDMDTTPTMRLHNEPMYTKINCGESTFESEIGSSSVPVFEVVSPSSNPGSPLLKERSWGMDPSVGRLEDKSHLAEDTKPLIQRSKSDCSALTRARDQVMLKELTHGGLIVDDFFLLNSKKCQLQPSKRHLTNQLAAFPVLHHPASPITPRVPTGSISYVVPGARGGPEIIVEGEEERFFTTSQSSLVEVAIPWWRKLLCWGWSTVRRDKNLELGTTLSDDFNLMGTTVDGEKGDSPNMTDGLSRRETTSGGSDYHGDLSVSDAHIGEI